MTKLSVVINRENKTYDVMFNNEVIAEFLTSDGAERFCWSKPYRDIIKFHLDKLNENK